MTRPAPVQRRSAWDLLEFVGYASMLVLLLLLRTDYEQLSLKGACQVTSVIAIACFVTVVRHAPRKLWSASVIFALMLWLFHCGLVLPWALGREPTPLIREPLDLWFFRPSTHVAVWLTSLGMVAYTLGVRLSAVFAAPPRVRSGDERLAPSLDHVFGRVGAVCLVGSLIMWFAIAVSQGGVGLLFGSYGDFLDATNTSTMPFAYRFTDYGAVLLAASSWSRSHRVAVVAYVLWTLVALPLGFRGEVLFPVLTALAVAGYRRAPLRPRTALIVVVAVLSLMAVVRSVRSVGLAKVGQAELSINPLDGMSEMGTSLRPVAEVVFWQEMGDPFYDGGTYWAPIDRSLYYVIPGWTRPPVEQDPRIPSNLVMERAGPIGFSMIAEAYMNFAAPGVFLVLALVGFILGRISMWPATQVYQCVAGMTLSAFLAHVRNMFLPIPSQLIMGYALIWALVLIARAQAERARPIPR